MIVIASDHGGYALKQELMAHLKEKGVEFEDIGTYSEASCNYPEYAERAARGVAEGKYEKGILVCGTGIGISIAANKVKGAYAALVNNVDLFLTTEFLGGRHADRVNMISALENHDR